MSNAAFCCKEKSHASNLKYKVFKSLAKEQSLSPVITCFFFVFFLSSCQALQGCHHSLHYNFTQIYTFNYVTLDLFKSSSSVGFMCSVSQSCSVESVPPVAASLTHKSLLNNDLIPHQCSQDNQVKTAGSVPSKKKGSHCHPGFSDAPGTSFKFTMSP